jgi:hypothetical protein
MYEDDFLESACVGITYRERKALLWKGVTEKGKKRVG